MIESIRQSKHYLNIRLPDNWAEKQGRLVLWAFNIQPEPDEGQVRATLRSGLRILLIMIQEFFDIKIALRASALTFSIILSMVPLLAMSTAILKGLGNENQLRTAVYRFIDQFDPERTQTTAPSATSDAMTTNSSEMGIDVSGSASHAETQPPSLNSHLHNAVEIIFKYVENTNFAALGAFGIAGLLIVVIMVFSSVEDAMNAIWHTDLGRSLFRKIMDYLALLILLPISINLALAGEAILESPVMMGYISTLIPSAWAVQMLLKLLPFVIITLSLMMMYLFFPHVKVKTFPAFCGAVFASLFWFIFQRTYVVLQIGVAKYNAIYGSFATIPLFMIWIYLGWTFILLGSVLAYAIQHRNQYRIPGTEPQSTPRQALQCAFDVLLHVYQNFSQGRPTPLQQLNTNCPTGNPDELARILDLLHREGLLHKTDDHENEFPEFMPSLPAGNLTAAQVVRMVLGQKGEGDTPGETLAELVINAGEKGIAPEDFPEKFLKTLSHQSQADGTQQQP